MTLTSRDEWTTCVHEAWKVVQFLSKTGSDRTFVDEEPWAEMRAGADGRSVSFTSGQPETLYLINSFLFFLSIFFI